MKAVSAVIFDMDGTMFDTERLYLRANQKAAKLLDMSIRESDYARFPGASPQQIQAILSETHSADRVQDFFSWSSHFYQKMIEAGDLPQKPGLMELLKYLKSEGVPLAVASSSQRKIIEELLEAAKIKDYFQVISAIEDVKKPKPHPEIYELTLAKLNSSLEESWIIEDSIVGVEAGLRSGMPVIMVPDLVQPPAHLSQDLSYLAKDLHEVKEYFSN